MFSHQQSVFLFLYVLISKVLANTSVIIIGAGPSGIAAATKLLENSITNITILEAEDRIGGRVNTINFGNGLVEMGAEYCHGEKDNIVYELANQFDLLESVQTSFITYYSNGSMLDPSLIKELEELILFYQEDESDYNSTGKSMADLFLYRYNLKQLQKYKNDNEKLKISKEALRFWEGYILMLEGAFSWSNPSVQSDWKESEGNQDLTWKGVGYKTILEILMKSYPNPATGFPIKNYLHLNSKVVKIDWGEFNFATVATSDGNTYVADYVIFTPSVGVLKHHHKTLFNPPLSIPKIDAIEKIGFEGVIKTFIYFPTKWWNDSDNYFAFFWSDEDFKRENFKDGPRKNNISWITQIRDMSQLRHNPNVWVSWIAGDMVPEIEQIPIHTFRKGYEYVLKKFLEKSYNVTKIDKIIHSSWCSNDNFGGTYSFTKAGTYQKGISYPQKLLEPLGSVGQRPKLLFAGEATNPIHFSTVHGATETGHREAKRIIDLETIKVKNMVM